MEKLGYENAKLRFILNDKIIIRTAAIHKINEL